MKNKSIFAVTFILSLTLLSWVSEGDVNEAADHSFIEDT